MSEGRLDPIDAMRERRKSTKETLAGSLLLAHPAMRDPNFRRSVVLMSVHNAEGAMGVVLNRPLGKRLGELSGEFALSRLASIPLFKGGATAPIQPHLICQPLRYGAYTGAGRCGEPDQGTQS